MTQEGVARKVAAAYGSTRRETTGSDELRRLALQFLPVVKSEVARFKMRLPRHVEAEELHGVAIGGLMRALERGTGVEEEKFGAYVRQRVRGAILDELRRLDVLSRTARRKAREYDRVVQEIEQSKGRLATETEVREALGLSESAYANLLDELRPVSFLSFDDPALDDGGNLPISERIEDPNAESVQDRVETNEVLELLEHRLESLPRMQQQILHMYYFKDFCLAEIAKVFELSESRICQLHTQAIRGLRVHLRKQMER